MKILVVDDEPLHRMLICDMLENEGWTTFAASNGEEALHTLETTSVDLIISDVYMPVMDGIKFYHAVRRLPAHDKLPFLFVSAYDDEHTISAVKASKFNGFLKKGRPPQELITWVKYLTTPEDKRSPMPPRFGEGASSGARRPVERSDRRSR